ncbi:hypothetical protein EIN_171690, partial [Entamoeba invadens IP1]
MPSPKIEYDSAYLHTVTECENNYLKLLEQSPNYANFADSKSKVVLRYQKFEAERLEKVTSEVSEQYESHVYDAIEHFFITISGASTNALFTNNSVIIANVLYTISIYVASFYKLVKTRRGCYTETINVLSKFLSYCTNTVTATKSSIEILGMTIDTSNLDRLLKSIETELDSEVKKYVLTFQDTLKEAVSLFEKVNYNIRQNDEQNETNNVYQIELFSNSLVETLSSKTKDLDKATER